MAITTTHYGGLPVKVLLNTNRGTKPNRQFEGGKAQGATFHETSNLFASARDNARYYASKRAWRAPTSREQLAGEAQAEGSSQSPTRMR